MRKSNDVQNMKVAKGWATIKRIEALEKGYRSLLDMTRAEVKKNSLNIGKIKENRNDWF